MSVERAVLSLPLADIAIGDRIGFYHEDHARGLADSMASDGQHDPIHVRKNGNAAKRPWTLVAGRHRVGAACILDWTHIDGIQVADARADAAALRRLELSENLDHRNPRPLERAIFIAARATLEQEAAHPGLADERPQDRAIRMRWAAAKSPQSDTSITMRDVSDWKARAASSLGFSIPTLERYIRLYATLIEPFIPAGEGVSAHPYAEQLNSHALGESLSAMTRIAQVATVQGRQAVIETIVSDPTLVTIDAAMAAAKVSTSKGSSVRTAAKPYNSFIGALGRMAAPERKAVAIEFAENVAPEVAKAMMKAFLVRGIVA